MTLIAPETEGTFGNLRYVVLSTKPANLAAVTVAEIAAGKNITCHMSEEWWPTSDTASVTRKRKVCQTSTTDAKAETKHSLPPIQYTCVEQSIGTPGAPGNEALEAMPEDADRYILMSVGVGSLDPFAAGDTYRLFPATCGYPDTAASQDDAGGETVVNQALFYMEGYKSPIRGKVAA